MSDFKIEKFKELCLALLDSGYTVIPVRSYLGDGAKSGRTAIMRHDVDAHPDNALKMAMLEHELDITSTYYFRYPYTFDREIIGLIDRLGHEIGYHYEVLSKANGDPEKAIGQFEYELGKFREICRVDTICMHGSILSKFDNRDLWKVYDFKQYGIIGEAYLSISMDVGYFSDTGQNWNWKNKMRDFIPGKTDMACIETTSDLVDLIKSNKYDIVYILTHPGNWAYDTIEWYYNHLENSAINLGKKALKAVRK